MGETAAACVRATMKFSFERLSCLLLTHAIRMKPHVIHLAMLEYGSKGAMYHGSMLIAGDAAFKANMKIMCTYVHHRLVTRISEAGARMTDDGLRFEILAFFAFQNAFIMDLQIQLQRHY